MQKHAVQRAGAPKYGVLVGLLILAAGSANPSQAESLPAQVEGLEERLRAVRLKLEVHLPEACTRGPHGSAGPTGLAGPRGYQGPAGPQGTRGSRGLKGKRRPEPNIALDGGIMKFLDDSWQNKVAIQSIPSGEMTIGRSDADLSLFLRVDPEHDQGWATFYDYRQRKTFQVAHSTEGSGAVMVGGKRAHDYAEVFELATRQGVVPGTVMSVAGDGVLLAPSATPYDPKVVGVLSGAGDLAPAVIVGARADATTDLPVAVMGRVYVRVCAEGGAIGSGDLLVSSSLPGVAMRATSNLRAFGRVIGKALEPFVRDDERPEGLIEMLILNR